MIIDNIYFVIERINGNYESLLLYLIRNQVDKNTGKDGFLKKLATPIGLFKPISPVSSIDELLLEANWFFDILKLY